METEGRQSRGSIRKQYESKEYTASLAYSYSPPLEPRQFQVLGLLPGPSHSKLQFKIDTYDLDAPEFAERYVAVSYTWNPSKFDKLYVALILSLHESQVYTKLLESYSRDISGRIKLNIFERCV